MITANLQLVGTAAVGPRKAEIGCAADRHLIATAAVGFESTKAESAEIVKSHLSGKAAVSEDALCVRSFSRIDTIPFAGNVSISTVATFTRKPTTALFRGKQVRRYSVTKPSL